MNVRIQIVHEGRANGHPLRVNISSQQREGWWDRSIPMVILLGSYLGSWKENAVADY
jgi:hypothetical protein